MRLFYALFLTLTLTLLVLVAGAGAVGRSPLQAAPARGPAVAPARPDN